MTNDVLIVDKERINNVPKVLYLIGLISAYYVMKDRLSSILFLILNNV